MTITTTISEDGTTAVPEELRQAYGLDPGSILVWKRRENGLHVEKKRDRTRGLLANNLDERERK